MGAPSLFTLWGASGFWAPKEAGRAEVVEELLGGRRRPNLTGPTAGLLANQRPRGTRFRIEERIASQETLANSYSGSSEPTTYKGERFEGIPQVSFRTARVGWRERLVSWRFGFLFSPLRLL